MGDGFDIIGWAELTPGTGTVNLAAALGETLYEVNGDYNRIRDKINYILGAFGYSVSTGGYYRVKQAKLPIYLEFEKMNLGADLDPVEGYTHQFGYPLPLIGNHNAEVQVNNATDEAALVGLILGTGKIIQSKLESINPTYRITASSDTDLVARTWTQSALTWRQTLPEGWYRVVGMRAALYKSTGAGAGLARLIFANRASNYRPGVPAGCAEGDDVESFQSVGQEPWAIWPSLSDFEFSTLNMPKLECLSTIAMTDSIIELLVEFQRELEKTG